MKSAKDMRCHECGAKMVHEVRPNSVTYQGHSRTVDILAWWCTSCDEAVIEGEAIQDRQDAFVALKAEVDGVAP